MNTLPTIDMAAIGHNIAQLRENSGLSARQLQALLRFSTPVFQNIHYLITSPE